MSLRVAVLSVHTCPLAPLGGWETGGLNVYVRETSRELAARGVQVDIFTRRQKDHTAEVVELAPRVRVVHIDAGPARSVDKYEVQDYLSEFTCAVQRFHLLTGSRYDLIHAHYWLSMRSAQLFQERWQVPMVAQFHTLAQLKNRVARSDAERELQVRFEIEKAAIAEADRVIAVSSADKRQTVEHYDACPRKIEIVPGGVDLTRFGTGSRAAARRALGLAVDEAVLLFVGRIQQLKGLDVLLHAAAELRQRPLLRRPLRVLIVGGQPAGTPAHVAEKEEIARIKELAQRLGLAASVSFVGAVEQPLLPAYYRAADVTVMPSSYESFGLVAAESMACGTPVVASQVGGLRSIVADGRTGYLIPWRNPRLFADKIELIVTRPELAERLGKAAVLRAQSFGWGFAAQRLLDIYEWLLINRRPMLEHARAGRPSVV